MSKKKGRRRKRKKPSPPVACPRCHSPADGSPGALLNALASVLNSCDQAGLKARLWRGGMTTREGHVLRRGSGRWGTAMLVPYGEPLAPDEDWDGD